MPLSPTSPRPTAIKNLPRSNTHPPRPRWHFLKTHVDHTAHFIFAGIYILDIRDIPVNQTIENKPRLFYMQIKLINVRVIISEYSLLDWYINMFMTSSIDRTKNTHPVRRFFFFLVVTLFFDRGRVHQYTPWCKFLSSMFDIPVFSLYLCDRFDI